MAGPGRLGVGVGVATGFALGLHAARRLNAMPHASRETRPSRLFIGSTSIRKGDSLPRVILWYVPRDAAARDAPESDPGRALTAQPDNGLASPIAGADSGRCLPLEHHAGSPEPTLVRLFPCGAWVDLRHSSNGFAKPHAGRCVARHLLGRRGPIHRSGSFVLFE